MESIFKKQDLFLAQMRKDYIAGNIPHTDILKPYLEGRMEEHSLLLPSLKMKLLPLCGTHENCWNTFMICILMLTRIFRHITVMTHGKSTPGMEKINTP